MNVHPATCSLFISAIALSLSSALSFAQVYQTVDKDGNPVFSDTPSEGAKQIDIQSTNTAKSVEVRPAASPPEKKATGTAEKNDSPEPEQIDRVDPYLIHSNNDKGRRDSDRPGHRPGHRPSHPATKPTPVARPANRR